MVIFTNIVVIRILIRYAEFSLLSANSAFDFIHMTGIASTATPGLKQNNGGPRSSAETRCFALFGSVTNMDMMCVGEEP